MNLELWAAVALIVVILAVLGYQYFKKPKPFQTADVAAVAAALKPHLASMFATARADAAKAGNAIASEFHHPAAPAADADAPLPAAALGTPVDSGGTAAVVTLWNDRVTAKHKELDAIIAAGKQAQAFKDALTAAQAELDKMTA